MSYPLNNKLQDRDRREGGGLVMLGNCELTSHPDVISAEQQVARSRQKRRGRVADDGEL